MRLQYVACTEVVINPWDADDKMSAMREEFKRLNSIPMVTAFMLGLIREDKQVVLVYATQPDYSLN